MASRFARFINSETGPRTVHFWAPVLKWSLVFAGISDFKRPAEKLSGTQQIALFSTGVIWTRFCFVIRPKNYLLASVNFFLGSVAATQLTRIYLWKRSQGATRGETISYILSGEKSETPSVTAEAKKLLENGPKAVEIK